MAEDSPTPTSVYRYYDGFEVLIYVGITSRGVQRNREHNGTQPWWPHVARQAVDHLPNRAAAEQRERELIRSHRPPFNKQHNVDWQAMQHAYFAFIATAGAQADSVGDLMRRGGRIRAVVETPDYVVTQVHDAVLLSGIEIPVGTPVVTRKGTQRGTVKRVDRRGPIFAIVLTQGFLAPGTPVDLVIKYIGANQDRRLTVKEVRLRKKDATPEDLAAKQERAERLRRKEMLRGRGKVIFLWRSLETWADFIVQGLWVESGYAYEPPLSDGQIELFGDVA